jgi:hypothetical protein
MAEAAVYREKLRPGIASTGTALLSRSRSRCLSATGDHLAHRHMQQQRAALFQVGADLVRAEPLGGERVNAALHLLLLGRERSCTGRAQTCPG